jgi:glycerophosphoryl diester phosphodiesterase
VQSYYDITSDGYLKFIRKYVTGIGPWKDTVVPPENNHLGPPTDLVARAHALNLQVSSKIVKCKVIDLGLHTMLKDDALQVHPYTFRNENSFLHFNFHQDPYAEYEYWLGEIGVDGLFTDFTGSLHKYQDWTAPRQMKAKNAEALLHQISNILKDDGY